MGRGVLRPDVDHVLFGLEDAVLLLAVRQRLHRFVGGLEAHGFVGQRLVGHAQGVELFGLVVLTHGVANPVFAQVDAAHIVVAHKADAVEVVHLALVDIGNVVETSD